MKPVRVHSAARRELAEAMTWYDGRCAGLGLGLLEEFQKAAAKLLRAPGQCSPYKRTGFRRQRMERFPYLIFFLELPDCIWLAAVAPRCARAGLLETPDAGILKDFRRGGDVDKPRNLERHGAVIQP